MSEAPSTAFGSRWVTLPEGVEELPPDTLAPGFAAGAAACGLKGGGATDVAVLGYEGSPPEGARSALLLTRNAAPAAPIVVCRDECEQERIAAVVVNSGNANAATGEQGLEDARQMQRRTAAELGCEPAAVAVAETGVIGVPLEINAVLEGIDRAAAARAAGDSAGFTAAIMTTDKGPKRCAVRANGVTLSAQAKGAGMIEPGFATMLCFVQTDAVVPDADAALRRAVAGSFERITVDGQMSTNDTVLLQASGAAGEPLPDGLLDAVLLQLALMIVADGEGASRVGRIAVERGPRRRRGGARRPRDRQLAARQDGALRPRSELGPDRAGRRAWPSPASGMSRSSAPERIDAAGLGGADIEAEIGIRLGRGEGAAHAYFSDLTHEYIRINAEYTT